ncbi:MAG: acetolactate synthase small subunit [Bacteroidetes bacterium]|nr:MAG: acetolactate synthase small subunit [Bacteroidota bacterium]
MEQAYTISVFTENKIGLLNRITIIFTRRKINVESLTVSESGISKDIFRFTVVIRTTPDYIGKVVKQIEKQIDVLKAFYYEDKDIIYQEIAMYKMPTSVLAKSEVVEKIVRNNNARILTIEEEFVVIEKTGHEDETQQLLEALRPYGLLSFARSGRVAIAKPMKPLALHLKELQEANS